MFGNMKRDARLGFASFFIWTIGDFSFDYFAITTQKCVLLPSNRGHFLLDIPNMLVLKMELL